MNLAQQIARRWSGPGAALRLAIIDHHLGPIGHVDSLDSIIKRMVLRAPRPDGWRRYSLTTAQNHTVRGYVKASGSAHTFVGRLP